MRRHFVSALALSSFSAFAAGSIIAAIADPSNSGISTGANSPVPVYERQVMRRGCGDGYCFFNSQLPGKSSVSNLNVGKRQYREHAKHNY